VRKQSPFAQCPADPGDRVGLGDRGEYRAERPPRVGYGLDRHGAYRIIMIAFEHRDPAPRTSDLDLAVVVQADHGDQRDPCRAAADVGDLVDVQPGML
jgi:hypothetical protein